MSRWIWAVGVVSLFLVSCETLDLQKVLDENVGGGTLSNSTIVAGLKDALKVGTENAVAQVSKPGGFNQNKLLHIGMPEELTKATKTLRSIGLGSLVDNFENKMNVSAEKASALATPIFLDAVTEMTFADARKILEGKGTEATDYFKSKTSAKLKEAFKPVIEKEMEQVGVVGVYRDLLKKYDAIPFTEKPNLNLEDYITDKTLSGLFQVVGEQEQLIRQDPAARTTELLKKVFGSIKKSQ